VRARGLKPAYFSGPIIHQKVAPRAGAWIETFLISLRQDANSTSRPVRARGLKPRDTSASRQAYHVAPRAGAWIETPYLASAYSSDRVAPRAGAWIETRRIKWSL